MSHLILTGFAEVRLKELADASFDSIVTDPPYELGFMGKTWDNSGIAYNVEMWRECLRVLKPGGHLLSFGGSRTYHRMACAIEDAGFEIRDQIMWVYGSGFPKSMDVSKAIDKAAGAEREVIGTSNRGAGASPQKLENHATGDTGLGILDGSGKIFDITAPTTDAAKQWDGWGTALKPAHEPIVLARKPLIGTVVANVLAHGTGAINIAACRVGNESIPINKLENWSGFGQEKRPDYEQVVSIGRWPANLIHDGSEEVMDAFPDAPGQMADVKYDASERKTQNIYGAMKRGHEPSADSANTGGVGFKMKPGARRLDEGSAARFFYCAKANGQDRHEGLENPGPQFEHGTTLRKIENKDPKSGNQHPTVKPTDLMRYLCRLVTPPGGTVLDPFTGSGSTGKAAIFEGFNFIGIEQSEEYVKIAEARIAFAVEEVARENAQQELFA